MKTKFLPFLFILCGGKFYMDWILITNPMSKNPLIKLLFGWAKYGYSGSDPVSRYSLAVSCGIVHIFGFSLSYYLLDEITLMNVLSNLYPIVVQLYIGIRCWKVIQFYKNRTIND